MRIGFDVSQTGTAKAGCGYVADSLIRELAEVDRINEYILYPVFGDGYWDPRGPAATRRIDRPSFETGWSPETHDAARAFWRHPPADLEERLGRPDLVHSHNFFCPPDLAHARLVYTLYDLAFLVHPEWTTEKNRLLCFEGVFQASLRADMILAISECSRRHFLEVFPHYPAERVRVLHLASRFEGGDGAAERPVSLPGHLGRGGFLLFVGTLEPRKNPFRLLRAYAGYVRRAAEPVPLVLAGGEGWLVDDFDRQVKELGIHEHVVRLGYVRDRELRWLYRRCLAFLYPSLFEGFGLPVLEAMSQGAAVLTSNVSSLPEVVGGEASSAALLVDPTDEDQLARAIERLAGDPELRERLRRAGRKRAAEFSWRRTAERVLELYEDTLAMEKSRSSALNLPPCTYCPQNQ